MLKAKYDRGQVVWMAGELLGAHWNIYESTPILIEISKNGTYAVSREAAIHGLDEVLKRIKKISKKNSILNILHEISETDNSKSVRLAAEHILRKTKF